MRRLLLTIISILFVCAYACALHVEAVGTAALVVNEGDTVFVFSGEPHLKTKGSLGTVTWYRLSDETEYATAADVYPDGDGLGLYIDVDGVREVFYVFDYRDYIPQLTDIQVTNFCRKTQLNVLGTIPEMRYRRPSGQNKTLPRTCSISYTDLSWDGEAWQDSLVVLTDMPLHLGTYDLDAHYRATSFAIAYEGLMAQLEMQRDSIISAESEPIAIKSNPVSITTVRGGQGELSNEVERPKESQALTGSAPLDILFRTNPSPAVEFYSWNIYQATRLIVSRTDQDTRYTFMEPGNYRVVGRITNSFCPCSDASDGDCAQDSVEFTISVSESMLLVPNVFTPNGDGMNDEFRVQYRSLREFHCWVYNRWGHLVYEWTDPAKGWDGTINGRPAAEGAYFYVIRALGTDAGKNAAYSAKAVYKKKQMKADESVIGVYQLSGDINLLR